MKWHLVALGIALCGGFACSEDSSDTEETNTNGDSTQPGSLALGENELVDAFPQGLAVDSLTTEVDDTSTTASASTIQIDDGTELWMQLPPPPDGSGETLPDGMQCVQQSPSAEDDPLYGEFNKLNPENFRKPPREKFELYSKILSAEQDQCVSPATLEAIKIIFITSQNENLDAGSGCYKPDWGVLTRDHDSGDVCMVGTARQQVDEASAYVEMVNGVVAAMLCQAKKDGKVEGEMEEGQSLDMTATLQGASGNTTSGFAVTSATVSRIASAGRPVYRSDLELTLKEKSFEIHLVNSPKEKGSIEGSGTIWMSHEHVALKDGQETTKTKAISITYKKAYDAKNPDYLRLNFEMRIGLFNTDFDVFGEDGVVDYNAGANFTGDALSPGYGNYTSGEPNDNAERMKYVVYDGLPELSVGRMSYWVNFGGRYDETARGFAFETRRVDGRLRGCGVAGATTTSLDKGVSIRKSLKEDISIQPRGYIRPLACDDKSGTKVWQQCFFQDDQGKFVIDLKKTKSESGIDFIDIAEIGVGLPKPRLAEDDGAYKPPLGDAGTGLPPPPQ